MVEEWSKVEEFFRFDERTGQYKSISILRDTQGNYYLKAVEGTKGSQGSYKQIMIKLDKNEIARLCLLLFKLSLS